MKYSISIAMATYNGEKFIIEQLESFANQTVLPTEVVITDDGSFDNTLYLINSFKATAPFDIRVYSNKTNLGYTQNFNKALYLCTNDLIFLSDQDDIWFPNKIEYMLGLANLHQSKDVFMIDAELVDGDLKSTGLTKQGQIKNLGLDKKAFVMGCCIAVRKNFLDIILPVPKDFKGHDNWIVELADFLQLRLVDRTVMQFYRRHGNNESNGIYNSLTKLNKYSVSRLITKIISLFKDSRISFLEKILHRKEIFLIESNRLLSHPKYKEQENTIRKNIQEDIKEDIGKLKKRLEIVQTKKIISRSMKAFSLYKSGKYKFKALMLDVILVKI